MRPLARLLLGALALGCVLEGNPAFEATTGGTSTTAPAPTSSTTGITESSGGTSAGPGTSTTAPASTDSGGSSSESGDPSATCNDGIPVAGERCHVVLASIVLGDTPRAIAAGDLDDDGWPDAVVLGSATEVLLLWGAGDGTLMPPETMSLPVADLVDVELADVDGDDDLDVIVVSQMAETVVVLAGNGGSFEPAIPSTLGSVRAVAVGQLAGAADPDLLYVVANAFARVAVGTGDGTFMRDPDLDVPLGAGDARHVITGDLDGDAWIDGVTINSADNSATVIVGGEPGPSAGITFAARDNATDLALADLDDDGLPEILVANQGDRSVTIASQGRVVNRLLVAPRPVALATADFDLDGFADLAIAQQTTKNHHLALRFGNGTLEPVDVAEYGVGTNPNALAVADFNADTVPDLAIVSAQSQDLHVLASSP